MFLLISVITRADMFDFVYLLFVALLGVQYITMARKMLIDGELSKTNVAESQYDYDLFVIGAGSGGVRASRFSAQNGAKV